VDCRHEQRTSKVVDVELAAQLAKLSGPIKAEGRREARGIPDVDA
jgi:hypothetical protein